MSRMRYLVTVGVVTAAMLSACGSTGNEDELVIEFLRFDGESITQCDKVGGGNAEVDVVSGGCDDGTTITGEPFTETAANATFRNNQALDITIDKYEVEIPDSGVGVFTGQARQSVKGRRCSSDPARRCSADSDCGVGGGTGLCQASETTIGLLLFDFTTKDLIVAQAAPFGRTFPVVVRFFGSDTAGGYWRVDASYQARFDNFNMCGCTLSQ